MTVRKPRPVPRGTGTWIARRYTRFGDRGCVREGTTSRAKVKCEKVAESAVSEKARVLLFGVHKEAATLQAVLDPATFAGIVFSDDAANYAHLTQAQKCWAH